MENTTISKERLKELLDNEAWVQALEAAGVDNWEGYDMAKDLYNDYNESKETK